MKNYTLLFLLLWNCLSLSAQTAKEKGLATITTPNAQAHIGFLAHDLLEGREAGSRGGKIAALYITSLLKQVGIAPLGKEYLQPFQALRGEHQKRWQIHPDSIAALDAQPHSALNMNNVLGMIPGKNADQYVIIGAHFDHLGINPELSGDSIYNGADDNASGVSAVLQIAQAFVQSGQQPERSVIFAFWDGEEIGLLGSRYFVEQCPFRDQIKSYLNFDMIGRNQDEKRPRLVDFFYTQSHPEYEKWLTEDIHTYQLELTPVFHPWEKPVGGSDNASFARHDIPIIWYHTNGHPDYHQPGDHTSKLNWEKLTAITKAAFLNLWNMANL